MPRLSNFVAHVALREARLVAAREYGVFSWSDLFIDGGREPPPEEEPGRALPTFWPS